MDGASLHYHEVFNFLKPGPEFGSQWLRQPPRLEEAVTVLIYHNSFASAVRHKGLGYAVWDSQKLPLVNIAEY